MPTSATIEWLPSCSGGSKGSSDGCPSSVTSSRKGSESFFLWCRLDRCDGSVTAVADGVSSNSAMPYDADRYGLDSHCNVCLDRLERGCRQCDFGNVNVVRTSADAARASLAFNGAWRATWSCVSLSIPFAGDRRMNRATCNCLMQTRLNPFGGEAISVRPNRSSFPTKVRSKETVVGDETQNQLRH